MIAQRLALVAAIAVVVGCRHPEPEPADEARLIAALDGGLDLEGPCEPAKGLRLQLKIGDTTELAVATRRTLRQTLGQKSDPSTSPDAVSSRSDGAVVLVREGVDDDGALLLRLTHPMLDVEPDLGSSAMRLAGLASKAAFRVTKAKDGTVVAQVLTVADAVAPLAATWASSLSLALPTLPGGPVSSGDTWSDRVDLAMLDDQVHLVAERTMTLRGTAPCRRLSGDCAVIEGTVRLYQSGRIEEDEDTVTLLEGDGEGRLHVWLSLAQGLPDAAELRYSMRNRVERAATGDDKTVVRQAREGVVVLSPPGGAP